jgi:prolyl-tRNA synthetase
LVHHFGPRKGRASIGKGKDRDLPRRPRTGPPAATPSRRKMCRPQRPNSSPAIIEASHDDKGIIWPEGVTPFPVGIVNLKQGDSACDAACTGIYKALAAKGLEALYDDRDERAGAKFATMDLIGLPWRITAGPRGLANGVVEVTSRRTGKSEEMSVEAAVDRIAQIYTAH